MDKIVGDKVFNVLFICTGNSARSIMAEAVLNRAGQRRFRAFSAGSQPRGHVHPYAIDLLKRLHYDVGEVRSKAGPNSPDLTRPSSISPSPFATMRPPRPIRFGQDNR